jgi:hypothetical protein
MKYYDFAEGAKTSLKVFREFFDTAYLYDPTFITISSLATEDTTTWSINKKYCILQGGTITLTYKDSSVTTSIYNSLYKGKFAAICYALPFSFVNKILYLHSTVFLIYCQ